MTQEIRRLFNSRLQGAASTSFLAEVNEVNSKACTCSVVIDDLTYDDVLIRAVSDGNNEGVILFPKVGSMVMATRIGGSNELYLSMFSEVDEVAVAVGDKTSLTINKSGVTCKVGVTAFTVEEDGILMASNTNNLKAVISELIDLVSQITVTAPPSGGTTSPPIKAASIAAIKDKLDFLK